MGAATLRPTYGYSNLILAPRRAGHAGRRAHPGPTPPPAPAPGHRVPRRLQALRGGDVGLEQATFSVEPRRVRVPRRLDRVRASRRVMRLLIKELEPTGGDDPRRRPRPGGDPAQARPVLPPQPRRRLPGLQAAAEPHRLRQRRLRAAGDRRLRKEIRAKVPDILRLTGLSTKLHNYPDQLSGGEQQRVSIARAFVNHPPLLLADEPTGNLDPETRIGIMQLLYRINRTGTTVRGRHPRPGDGRQDAPPRDRALAAGSSATRRPASTRATRPPASWPAGLRAPSTPPPGRRSRCGSASSSARRSARCAAAPPRASPPWPRCS